MKTIITFGSKHLPWLHHKLNPMNIALVIEADNENIARKEVFNSRIGERFATSYPYDDNIERFKTMGMKEYGLEDLDAITIEYDDIEWRAATYGTLVGEIRDYLIYFNQYNDNYDIDRHSDYSKIIREATKKEMLDFLNNKTA